MVFGVEKDDALAVDWYLKTAESDRTDAMMELGDRFASGKGVEQNYEQAIEWYRKAAEEGYGFASYGSRGNQDHDFGGYVKIAGMA